MLFIETDASDIGWGACAYQFEDFITLSQIADSAADDESGYRLMYDMKKPKRAIEWISKA